MTSQWRKLDLVCDHRRQVEKISTWKNIQHSLFAGRIQKDEAHSVTLILAFHKLYFCTCESPSYRLNAVYINKLFVSF